LLAFAPLLLLIGDSDGLRVVAIGGTVVLVLLWVLVLIVASILIGLFTQFWRRAAVVDDLGLFESIAAGIRLARDNKSDAAKMWLLMLGVSIVWTLVSLMLFALFVAAALAVAGVPAYLLYQNTDSLVLPLLYGIPVGILVLFLPSAVVAGLYRIFEADVWGIVYRDLAGRDRGAFVAPAISGT
jgi:hypothetical protein